MEAVDDDAVGNKSAKGSIAAIDAVFDGAGVEIVAYKEGDRQYNENDQYTFK